MKKKLFIVPVMMILIWCLLGTKPASAAQLPVYILNPNRVIPPNSTTKITIQGTKHKAKWRSSNPKQITVNQSGVVKVKKKGVAMIYGDVKEKGIRYIVSCRIEVLAKYDEKNVPANDITAKQVKKYKKAYKTGKTSGLSKKEKKVYKQLKKALDSAKGCKTRIAKELAVHDWIVNNTQYMSESQTKSKSVYSMEGVFLYKKAVCNGYMNAFKLCLKILDVPCETVLGIEKSTKNLHSWLRVKLDDGKWYHCDATFDDARDGGKDTGVISYAYFNCTDKQMSHMYYIKSRKCSATKYGFKNVKKDYFVTDDESLCKAIKAGVQSDKKTIQIFVDTRYHLRLPSDKVLTSYAGKNISASINDSIPMYTIRKEVTPNGQPHATRFLNITYVNNDAIESPFYVTDMQSFQDYLLRTIQSGKTKCTNLYFTIENSLMFYYLKNDVILYDLLGKHIKIDVGGYGSEVPTFLTPGMGQYYDFGDVSIDYSHKNDRVIIPSTIEDFTAQMDVAFANHQTNFILYGKDLEPDELAIAIGHWEIRNRATIKSSNIDYVLSYNWTGITNPVTGQVRKPKWYDFEFTY